MPPVNASLQLLASLLDWLPVIVVRLFRLSASKLNPSGVIAMNKLVFELVLVKDTGTVTTSIRIWDFNSLKTVLMVINSKVFGLMSKRRYELAVVPGFDPSMMDEIAKCDILSSIHVGGRAQLSIPLFVHNTEKGYEVNWDIPRLLRFNAELTPA